MIYPSQVLGLQQGGCNEIIHSIQVISCTKKAIVGDLILATARVCMVRLASSCCDCYRSRLLIGNGETIEGVLEAIFVAALLLFLLLSFGCAVLVLRRLVLIIELILILVPPCDMQW